MRILRCFLRDDAIELEAPGLEPHALPRAITDGRRAEVSVWSTRCEALVDVAASTWMTRALGRSNLVLVGAGVVAVGDAASAS